MREPLEAKFYRIDPGVKIFRCKFQAAPGHQFDVRAQAYRRIEAALQETGIRFADGTQTVLLSSAPGEKTAVMGPGWKGLETIYWFRMNTALVYRGYFKTFLSSICSASNPAKGRCQHPGGYTFQAKSGDDLNLPKRRLRSLAAYRSRKPARERKCRNVPP
jgi:hypothetical protein